LNPEDKNFEAVQLIRSDEIHLNGEIKRAEAQIQQWQGVIIGLKKAKEKLTETLKTLREKDGSE